MRFNRLVIHLSNVNSNCNTKRFLVQERSDRAIDLSASFALSEVKLKLLEGQTLLLQKEEKALVLQQDACIRELGPIQALLNLYCGGRTHSA